MKTLFAILVIVVVLAHASAFALNAGDAAPGFSLRDATGNTVTLDSMKGKVVFLTFWAPWCQSCREELPALDALHRKYVGSDFTVLGICIDPSESAIARFLQKYPLSYPVMIDKKGDVADAYFFSSLPASFLIGKDGNVKHKHMGYGKDFLNIYEQEITDLLKK